MVKTDEYRKISKKLSATKSRNAMYKKIDNLETYFKAITSTEPPGWKSIKKVRRKGVTRNERNKLSAQDSRRRRYSYTIYLQNFISCYNILICNDINAYNDLQLLEKDIKSYTENRDKYLKNI